MRYQTLAVALVGMLAGPALAQTSVTLFGKIDSGYVNNIGSATALGIKGLGEGAQSRVGFRGTEDLGNGLKAFFWLEHRFRSDTGQQTAVRYFQGQSIVGLQGDWGTLTLGRDYVAGYIEVQLISDPFIHTGVASMVAFANGGIGTVRNDGAITYKLNNGKLSLSAQRGEPVNPNSTVLPSPRTAENPVALSASYKGNDWVAGYVYENPGGVNDVWHQAVAQFAVGPAVVSLGYGQGRTNTLAEYRSYVVGAYVPTQTGRFKIALGDLRNKSTSTPISRKFAIGYNHNLTKRSFVYLNVARDRMATADRNGFDVGIQHNF